jgi:hypothetical protein
MFFWHGLMIWQTKDFSPPHHKAMPWVRKGLAIYFWVILYLKTIQLPIEPNHFLKIKNQKDEDYFFIFLLKKYTSYEKSMYFIRARHH